MNVARLNELQAQQKEKQQLIFDAENALASAKHQHENISKLIAIVACPFNVGETIVLPSWRGKEWVSKGCVNGIKPVILPFPSRSLYTVDVDVLRKDGSVGDLKARFYHTDELELKNGKSVTNVLLAENDKNFQR